jgi:capsular exopolysaccharide synthesis family protein
MKTIDSNITAQNFNHFGSNSQNGSVEPEVKLQEILQILNRRKLVIIFLVMTMLTLAIIYNIVSPPVYEASAIIKKEKVYDDRSADDLTRIFLMQSFDDVETETEILKTRTVLEKVVNELILYFTINRITTPGVVIQKDRILLSEYQQYLSGSPDNRAPRLNFQGFLTPTNFRGGDFYLVVTADSMIEFHDAKTDYLIKKVKNTSPAEIKLTVFNLSVNWPQAPPGSRIDFRLENLDKAIQKLEKNISVEVLRKTDLFKLSARSSSPYMAQLIANTIAKKFRETRLEQKRQIINYSYNFVDNHLKEISENLKNAERELNDFRGKYQIFDIDDVSKQTIDFLSELEAEKIKIELELAQYRNRYEAVNNELQQKGYFDQTYLAPDHSDPGRSPFSSLLEQLSDAELERLDLLQKRTENHPEVRAVSERIVKIKNKLSSYNRNTVTAYEIIIKSLSKKLNNLEDYINKYSERERNLPGHETKLVELMRNKNAYEKIFTLLLDKREEMRMAELSKLQDIVIVNSARLPIMPVLPRKRFNVIVGFFLGIIIGSIIIIWQEFRNKTIQNLAEIEKGFQIPILAILPKYNRALEKKIRNGFNFENHTDIFRDPRLGYIESYRVIRTKLGQLMPKKNIVIFTSCEEDTGKTTILANFAVALGLAGKKVLVIDCDLKKMNLGDFFSIPPRSPGIIDFLIGKLNKPPIYRPLEGRLKEQIRLHVIPTGGIVENSSELLELDSLKFKTFLENASQHYDYILVDTPPVTMSVDSLVLGKFIKEVILIIRPDLTYKDRLGWAIQELKLFDIQILGSIVNGCDMKNLDFPYRHGYGYGYGYHYGDLSKVRNLILKSPGQT